MDDEINFFARQMIQTSATHLLHEQVLYVLLTHLLFADGDLSDRARIAARTKAKAIQLELEHRLKATTPDNAQQEAFQAEILLQAKRFFEKFEDSCFS